MNISKIIYNVTGRMTKKHIVRTAEDIGKSLIKRAHNQGDTLQISDIREILTEKIGKKKASKIIVSDKLDDLREFMKKNLGLSDDMIDMTYFYSKGAIIPGWKSKKTFFKINLNDFQGLAELVNTIAHESEHLLFQNFSFRNLLEKITVKIRGQKYLQNYIEKYANIINEKVFELQYNLISRLNIGNSATPGFVKHKNNTEGLLKQLGLHHTPEKLTQSLRQRINDNILIPGENKLNLKILKALKQVLKDESRAYNVGGRVERSLFPATERATKSEMLARLYDETIKVLSDEIKTRRKNKLRKMFGLKEK